MIDLNANELSSAILERIDRCVTLTDVDNAHELICRVVEVRNRRKYIDILVVKEIMIIEEYDSYS